MGIREILIDINDETRVINSPDFTVEISKAVTLPSIDDASITFENFDFNSKKAKLIETCVLHIDIRQSTKLNMEHKPVTLARLYSSFIRGVIKCATQFNGKVRNIVGDRVMILFDKENCFNNVVNTAILLNTFSIYILNRHFKNNEIRCGIGIDYGKMLVTKTGTIKRGSQNSEYKSLVWLGPPANIASKLADIANKTFSRSVAQVGHYFPYTDKWHWSEQDIEEFFDNLEPTYSYPTIAQFKEPYIRSFFKNLTKDIYDTIIMTPRVYNGYKNASPNEESIINKWWKIKKASVEGYSGDVYHGSIHYTFGKTLE